MCEDSDVTSDRKKIFAKRPTFTTDNYFCSEQSLNIAGERNCGAIFTNARTRLPPEIAMKYLHKEKTSPVQKHAKTARMLQPIIAVKNDKHDFQRVHVSFQSTSSCNIVTVNALNDCWHFVELHEKSRGANKRHWVIEMNHARRLYLSLYCWIDVLDGFIEKYRIFFKCWKYWHSPINHCLSMTIVTAYEMYREVCEGKLEDVWKVDDVISFKKFRETLGSQMLKYTPMNQKYPGDERLRVVTRLSRKQRRGKKRVRYQKTM